MSIRYTIETIANIVIERGVIEFTSADEQHMIMYLARLVRSLNQGLIPTHPARKTDCEHGEKCIAMTLYHSLALLGYSSDEVMRSVCGCYYFYNNDQITENQRMIERIFIDTDIAKEFNGVVKHLRQFCASDRLPVYTS